MCDQQVRISIPQTGGGIGEPTFLLSHLPLSRQTGKQQNEIPLPFLTSASIGGWDAKKKKRSVTLRQKMRQRRRFQARAHRNPDLSRAVPPPLNLYP